MGTRTRSDKSKGGAEGFDMEGNRDCATLEDVEASRDRLLQLLDEIHRRLRRRERKGRQTGILDELPELCYRPQDCRAWN